MPPRIPFSVCLRASQATKPENLTRSFSASSPVSASTSAQRKRHRDPYAIAQARARKAANVSRQEVLRKERAALLGDPVRGITTPFVESFDNGVMPTPGPSETTSSTTPLNFALSEAVLNEGIERSKRLSTPRDKNFLDFTSSRTPEERQSSIQSSQETAEEAIRRISNLSMGNNKARLLINKQRCIDHFGRHSTDAVLQSGPKGESSDGTSTNKMPRVGPDTGSSEVQIAILTAKIRAVADGLDSRGRMDKMNKRNLRLLVHRRQKLLRYLHRKEKGGPRWTNLIQTLGLTEGTWKGEITL